MKLAPSPAGGLRIEVEEADDWPLLCGILHDAESPGFDLASHVGSVMQPSADWLDWQEYVMPDIREGYQEHLKVVLTAIESAKLEAAGGPATLWISRDDAFHWYAALNQARLAIEELHHFGPGENISQLNLSPSRHAAFFRSQLYCAIQSFLLDMGLG
ncbi:MAG: hypothetical protein WCO57_14695 [Verrucomicrobiota bacterium]